MNLHGEGNRPLGGFQDELLILRGGRQPPPVV